MIKVLNRAQIKENFLKTMNGIYKEPTANIIIVKVKKENDVLYWSFQPDQLGKKNKRHQIDKDKVNLFLFLGIHTKTIGSNG